MGDIPRSQLVANAAAELKKIESIKAPEWATYVKTGRHKERPPRQQDWWHTRAASVLQKIEALGPIGVSKLRTKYGGKQRRGHKPPRFAKGSGNIVRKILQQLEKAGLIKETKEGLHRGREITPKGRKLLSAASISTAKQEAKAPKKEAKKAAPAKEPKAPKEAKAPKAPKEQEAAKNG